MKNKTELVQKECQDLKLRTDLLEQQEKLKIEWTKFIKASN